MNIMNNFVTVLSNIVSDDGVPDFKVNPYKDWFMENWKGYLIVFVYGILVGIGISIAYKFIKKEISESKKNKANKNSESE